MISATDWERMPWSARQKYLRRHRTRMTRVTEEQVEREPRMLSEVGIRRCGSCGGWVYRSCSLHPGG